MNIKIFVFNYLTKETIIDNTIEVNGDAIYTDATAEANHKMFREYYPDCQVNFVIDSKTYLMSQPLNQEKDEKSMPYEQYMDKWYSGPYESDDDMPDYEIERQIDDLLEADSNQRDSVSY
jgi:hypothetical protein